MLLKRKEYSECNKMGNSDAHTIRRPGTPHGHGRKYLTQAELQRVLAASSQHPEAKRLFIETLACSGARISEVLALTPSRFDLELNSVTLLTLKRRRMVMRVVPLPPGLVAELDDAFQLRRAQQQPEHAHQRLWPFHRVTGWRLVKSMMDAAGIAGQQARPHGLRHGFGVGALQAGVPLTLLKRWMGHARLSTTEIYLDVIGPEEIAFARRFWASMAMTAIRHGRNASHRTQGKQRAQLAAA
jgi:site-specific recombinase XerD